MTEPDPDRRSSSAAWGLSLVVAVVAYVLSPGIFIWADAHGYNMSPLTERVFRVIYAPLGFLNDHVPAVKSFYDWYFQPLR
jgi:hypothetical protein